jgi:hypothetical protein
MKASNLRRAAGTLQRNLDLCIPRKGIARPQSQFHIHVISDFHGLAAPDFAIQLINNQDTFYIIYKLTRKSVCLSEVYPTK